MFLKCNEQNCLSQKKEAAAAAAAAAAATRQTLLCPFSTALRATLLHHRAQHVARYDVAV